MSILDNYTQTEIDSMDESTLQAHKDVDAYKEFINSIPSEQENIESWLKSYKKPISCNLDTLAAFGAIKGFL